MDVQTNNTEDLLLPTPPTPTVLPKFFPININLHTNLPDDNDETGLATKIFTLTGDMIGSSPNKPFFSSEVDYSYGSSFFTDIREEQINVFFDRNIFRKFIIECYNKKLNEINSTDSAFLQSALEEYNNEIKDALEENGIAERNILFMLNMLIKVSFPKKTKVKETYNKHKTNALSIFKNPINSLKMFYSPFVYYTYINYEGKDYTVVKAHWQNDFYSHPEFFKLYKLYSLYTEWFNPEKKEEIVNKFKDSSYFTGTQLYSENIIEYIVIAFAQNFMKKEYAVDYLKSIMTFDGKTLPYEKYEEEKDKIYEVFKEKEYNTVESRENYLKEKKIVAIKEFEPVNTRAIYSENNNNKSARIIDFNNYMELIERVHEFIESQPDWKNFNELKNETLNKVKENIYNKKLRCLLSDITYLSKNNDAMKPVEVKQNSNNGYDAVADADAAAPPTEIDKNKTHCDNLLKNVRDQIERRNFYVGVQKKGGVNGEFEISLYVDLFGGKIDQKNKRRYRCAFFGEKLGNEFETLWNGRYYVKSRFFFDSADFEEGEEKTSQSSYEKKLPDESTSKKSENTSKKGKKKRKKDDDDDDSDDDNEHKGGMTKPLRRRRKTLKRKRTTKSKLYNKNGAPLRGRRRHRKTIKFRPRAQN